MKLSLAIAQPFHLVRVAGALDFDFRSSIFDFVQIAFGQLNTGRYAEGASSAAFQRPEQIGVGPRIRDANLAVGSNYFGLE
jgi:hypothetical protein